MSLYTLLLCLIYFVSGFLVGGGSVFAISVVLSASVARIWAASEIFISVSCGMRCHFRAAFLGRFFWSYQYIFVRSNDSVLFLDLILILFHIARLQ